MGIELQTLAHLKVPVTVEKHLNLDGRPVRIAVPETVLKDEESTNLTAAIGVATVLYQWCPDALYAFLDLDSWFSFTWIRTIQAGERDETKCEIGRIKNVITMGVLDKEEHWKVMVSYTISEEGSWIPNTDESMLDDQDIKDPSEIDKLGRSFVKDLILQQAWSTGKKIRHDFFIEYAPMDAFSDGIAMNPHWLYQAIDLTKCTTCGKGEEASLSRCSKCGTAAYCSGVCQRADWAVHKAVCNMNMEDRGKALHLSKDGGLVRWSRLQAQNESIDDEVSEGE
ncbi:hypothetical protein M409DRAFT_62833 [Zasmidium cellare ATCC 36951]|uniref:MYND-type domain-containing protein n=1 Tax=Zasmidium cellare ATCC 36951 TaxID=1080233 RepID=A0A6A6D1P5_ZASCE|nr:uncharacterized protein M409DRAFT_62833 [Zasmidium cellare ATCC 36951]KAF2173281.1 hypothetical protein M409DRAFT_62833 [Zasmidium cellare ATCC 36951]